jgi:alpha-glucosidase
MSRYNSTIWGPSGNMTINGSLTYADGADSSSFLSKRGIGAGGQSVLSLDAPPYPINNGLPANQILFRLYANLD